MYSGCRCDTSGRSPLLVACGLHELAGATGINIYKNGLKQDFKSSPYALEETTVLVRLLLSAGAGPNSRDTKGAPPLFSLLHVYPKHKIGVTNAVTAFFESTTVKVDLGARDMTGMTVNMLLDKVSPAAENSQLRTLLVSQGLVAAPVHPQANTQKQGKEDCVVM